MKNRINCKIWNIKLESDGTNIGWRAELSDTTLKEGY
jgi:hypothetical protein